MDSRKRVLDLKLPAFPEPATLPRIPSYESIISSNFEDDELKPNAMRTSLEKPLFIKVDKYEKVVSSINMIKQKLGDSLMTKNFTAQKNEILAKVVCHNTAALSEALLTYQLKVDFLEVV